MLFQVESFYSESLDTPRTITSFTWDLEVVVKETFIPWEERFRERGEKEYRKFWRALSVGDEVIVRRPYETLLIKKIE